MRVRVGSQQVERLVSEPVPEKKSKPKKAKATKVKAGKVAKADGEAKVCLLSPCHCVAFSMCFLFILVLLVSWGVGCAGEEAAQRLHALLQAQPRSRQEEDPLGAREQGCHARHRQGKDGEYTL
jgi:hypothetical protein